MHAAISQPTIPTYTSAAREHFKTLALTWHVVGPGHMTAIHHSAECFDRRAVPTHAAVSWATAAIGGDAAMGDWCSDKAAVKYTIVLHSGYSFW